VSVRARLTVAFLATALLVPAVGLLAVRQQYQTSQRAAQVEARHVAEPIAHTIANTAELSQHGQAQLYQQPRLLQEYISDLHRDLRRDIVVVDPSKRILADAIPANQGTIFTHDTHGEIPATIGDGRPRTFTERSPDFPDGIQQIVIALRSETGDTVGAVIMEYTPMYRELVAAGAGVRRVILVVSVAGLALALLLGYLLARGMVRDLRALGEAAGRLADGHDDARAQLRGRDELAQLATTFNNMAARIAAQKAVLTEVAISDPLTGLHNRRSFQVRLAEEMPAPTAAACRSHCCWWTWTTSRPSTTTTATPPATRRYGTSPRS
jgi:HAMP domain-containing protein